MATEVQNDEIMETEEQNSSPKKQKRFHAREFREKLNSSDHNGKFCKNITFILFITIKYF